MTRTGEHFVDKKLVVRYLIVNGPGRTETELMRAIHGSRVTYRQVNRTCRELVEAGLVKRTGSGRTGSPYRYWPIP